MKLLLLPEAKKEYLFGQGFLLPSSLYPLPAFRLFVANLTVVIFELSVNVHLPT